MAIPHVGVVIKISVTEFLLWSLHVNYLKVGADATDDRLIGECEYRQTYYKCVQTHMIDVSPYG